MQDTALVRDIARLVPAEAPLLVTVPRLALAHGVAGLVEADARTAVGAKLREWSGIDLMDSQAMAAAGVQLDGPAGLAVLDVPGQQVVAFVTVADEPAFRAAVGDRVFAIAGGVAALPIVGGDAAVGEGQGRPPFQSRRRDARSR